MNIWPDLQKQSVIWGTQRVLAMTAWGEARGWGMSGMRDVMSVVLNRVEDATYWGNDITSVCLDEWQFSCWAPNDPNRQKMIACGTGDPEMEQALGLAYTAIKGMLPDSTGHADSYFATSIAPPFWAKPPARHTVTRGPHSFWITTPDIAPTISTHAAPLTTDELNAQYSAVYAKDGA